MARFERVPQQPASVHDMLPQENGVIYTPMLVSADKATMCLEAAVHVLGVGVTIVGREGDIYRVHGKPVDVPPGFLRIQMHYRSDDVRQSFWHEVDRLAEITHQRITGKPSGLYGRGLGVQLQAKWRGAQARLGLMSR